MGANSVTGTGIGSVEKFGGGKGPGNLRTNSVPMQSPHVVAAGVLYCNAEELTQGENPWITITFPKPLPLTSDNYSILVVGGGTASYHIRVRNSSIVDTNGQFVSFDIEGADYSARGTQPKTGETGVWRINWTIVRTGFGLEAQTSWVPSQGNSVNAP